MIYAVYALTFLIINMLILYFVVKYAINNSITTQLLIEIRDLLRKIEMEKKAIDID